MLQFAGVCETDGWDHRMVRSISFQSSAWRTGSNPRGSQR